MKCKYMLRDGDCVKGYMMCNIGKTKYDNMMHCVYRGDIHRCLANLIRNTKRGQLWQDFVSANICAPCSLVPWVTSKMDCRIRALLRLRLKAQNRMASGKKQMHSKKQGKSNYSIPQLNP
jgi:hypothetical protein